MIVRGAEHRCARGAESFYVVVRRSYLQCVMTTTHSFYLRLVVILNCCGIAEMCCAESCCAGRIGRCA